MWRNEPPYTETGSWNWRKDCEIPTGEQTTPAGWNGSEATEYNWRATLQPTSKNFGGRTVQETVATADFCRWALTGSQELVRFSLAVDVNTSNTYIDVVGYRVETVRAVRMLGLAPCSFTSNQTLTIDCGDGDPMYFFNQLGASITTTTVSSSRAGQTATRNF